MISGETIKHLVVETDEVATTYVCWRKTWYKLHVGDLLKIDHLESEHALLEQIVELYENKPKVME